MNCRRFATCCFRAWSLQLTLPSDLDSFESLENPEEIEPWIMHIECRCNKPSTYYNSTCTPWVNTFMLQRQGNEWCTWLLSQ